MIFCPYAPLKVLCALWTLRPFWAETLAALRELGANICSDCAVMQVECCYEQEDCMARAKHFTGLPDLKGDDMDEELLARSGLQTMAEADETSIIVCR